MTPQSDIVKAIDKLKWARMALILLSFAVGLALVGMGQVRPAFFVVGATFLLAGLGYPAAQRAVLRSVSAKTGKTVAQLTEELKNHSKSIKQR